MKQTCIFPIEKHMKSLLKTWWQNLKAETPRAWKILRTTSAVVSASAGAASTAFNNLPSFIQSAIPDKILTTLAIATAVCAIVAQSQKKKDA